VFRAGRGPKHIACADFDGDGFSDLFVGNQDGGNLSFLVNDGTGRFSEPIESPLRYSFMDIAATDIDGDGDADLAVSENHWGTAMLVNDGSGRFSTEYRTNTFPSTFIGYNLVARDMDGDETPDLVMSADHEMTILFNRCLP
jgi:hypothetical protein